MTLPPLQTELFPEMEAVGLEYMINVFSAVALHPLASVTVTVTGVPFDTVMVGVVGPELHT